MHYTIIAVNDHRILLLVFAGGAAAPAALIKHMRPLSIIIQQLEMSDQSGKKTVYRTLELHYRIISVY